MIAVITQKLRQGADMLRVGEIVDASSWPRRESLVVRRYIREASPSEVEQFRAAQREAEAEAKRGGKTAKGA